MRICISYEEQFVGAVVFDRARTTYTGDTTRVQWDIVVQIGSVAVSNIRFYNSIAKSRACGLKARREGGQVRGSDRGVDCRSDRGRVGGLPPACSCKNIVVEIRYRGGAYDGLTVG